MICRTCLRRASGLASIRTAPASAAVPAAFRALSISSSTRQAAAPAAAASPAEPLTTPKLSTPVDGTAAAQTSTPTRPPSSCAAGTVLNGLNYFKGKTDPVALPDEEYPDWLWDCLTFKAKADDGDANAADEFCKLTSHTYPGNPRHMLTPCFQRNRRSSESSPPSASWPPRPCSWPRETPTRSRPRCPCSSSRSTCPEPRAAMSTTTSTRPRSARSSGRRCARSARPRSRRPTTSSRCKEYDRFECGAGMGMDHPTWLYIYTAGEEMYDIWVWRWKTRSDTDKDLYNITTRIGFAVTHFIFV